MQDDDQGKLARVDVSKPNIRFGVLGGGLT